jgi:hypothetical protein
MNNDIFPSASSSSSYSSAGPGKTYTGETCPKCSSEMFTAFSGPQSKFPGMEYKWCGTKGCTFVDLSGKRKQVKREAPCYAQPRDVGAAKPAAAAPGGVESRLCRLEELMTAMARDVKEILGHPALPATQPLPEETFDG